MYQKLSIQSKREVQIYKSSQGVYFFDFSSDFMYSLRCHLGFHKEPACQAGDIKDAGLIPESGISPEVTHSNILAWRIPWTEEPGGPQSTGLQRVGRG